MSNSSMGAEQIPHQPVDDALDAHVAAVAAESGDLRQQVPHFLGLHQTVAHVTFLRVVLAGNGPVAAGQPRSPPATGNVTPVMYEASSEARNRIAAACSSVVP